MPPFAGSGYLLVITNSLVPSKVNVIGDCFNMSLVLFDPSLYSTADCALDQNLEFINSRNIASLYKNSLF